MNPSHGTDPRSRRGVPGRSRSSSCPTTRTSSPSPSRLCALTGHDVRVVPTRSVTEGLAAAFAYDPEGSGDDNDRAMAVGGRRGRHGRGHHAPSGTRLPMRARSRRATTSASSRDGIVATGHTVDAASTALLAALLDGRPRDRDHHRGRGGERRRHPAHHRVAGRPPQRRHGRGPSRWPAPVPLPVLASSRCRATLPQLRRIPVTTISGVGTRRAEALQELEIDNVLDLSPTTRAAGSTAPTRRRSPTSSWASRPRCSWRCAALGRCPPARASPGSRSRSVTAPAASPSCSSTSPGG